MEQKVIKAIGYAGLVLSLAMLIVLLTIFIIGESVPEFIMYKHSDYIATAEI